MFQIKNKNLINFILWFSVFSLFVAYFIQYFLNHQPCNLCLIERIPYGLNIIIIIISYIFKRYEKISLALLSLIFFSATLISFYHFGIEQGFINESLVCDLVPQSNNLTAEDILNELNQITISCKDVNFKILGFSLASINTIISFTLGVIVARNFYNYDKNK